MDVLYADLVLRPHLASCRPSVAQFNTQSWIELDKLLLTDVRAIRFVNHPQK